MEYRQKWDETSLLGMIRDEVQESSELDYKSSLSIDKTGGKKGELTKDVSAFANANGGTLIYGMEENGHIPTKIDCGYDPNELTKEWIENVITSLIHPRIEELRITPIPLVTTHPGRIAYAIEIPQARTFAPHQAADKRYYVRFNFQSVPMEDYQIRDLLQRATTPDLQCRLLLNLQGAFLPTQDYDTAIVNFPSLQSPSDPVWLQLAVENRSAQPASHARLTIDCPVDLIPSLQVSSMRAESVSPQRIRFTRIYGFEGDLPLWQGETWIIPEARIGISIPARHQSSSMKWSLLVVASAPGKKTSARFGLEYEYPALTLYPR